MRARWTTTRARMLLSAATRYIALSDLLAMPGGAAHAGVTLEKTQIADEVQLARPLPTVTQS
jgi:hypothetical protein